MCSYSNYTSAMIVGGTCGILFGLGPMIASPFLAKLGVVSGAAYQKIAFAWCNYTVTSVIGGCGFQLVRDKVNSDSIKIFAGVALTTLILATIAAPILSGIFLNCYITYFESSACTLLGSLLFSLYLWLNLPEHTLAWVCQESVAQ